MSSPRRSPSKKQRPSPLFERSDLSRFEADFVAQRRKTPEQFQGLLSQLGQIFTHFTKDGVDALPYHQAAQKMKIESLHAVDIFAKELQNSRRMANQQSHDACMQRLRVIRESIIAIKSQ